jgi:recombination protein RecR
MKSRSSSTFEPQGAIGRLLAELGKLPGIGPKSAERIANHLLSSPDRSQMQALAEALREVKERVHTCRQCFNLTENETCSICADVRRDATLLCVVEQPKDVATLERTGMFRGLYHVLQGRLAPLENMGPERLTLDALLYRVKKGGVKEVLLATNPTLEGDGTSLYISNLLAESGIKLTRLARGISSGSALDFANPQMLADAIEDRRTF